MDSRGTPSNLGLDPAGAKMKYVPIQDGGDLSELQNRMQTFNHVFYSQSRNKNIQALANAGFYYLDFKNYTKCFNCGMGVSDWSETDVPSNPYFHGQGCRFATNTVHSQLNESGFASISGNSPSFSITSNTSPNIPGTMLLTSNVTIPSSTFTTSQQPSTEEPFPCLHPTTPNMRHYEDRKRSFVHATWTHQLNISADILASSGFFYLDESDKVKCFYCNGGLENWHMNDDPWREHAKWFPNCEHVLKNKGVEYVTSIPRPHQTQQRRTILPEVQSNIQSQPPIVTVASTPPTEPSPSSRQPQTSGNVMSNLIAKQAVDMGFSEQLIKHAYDLQKITKNSTFDTLASLLEVLMQLEDDDNTMYT